MFALNTHESSITRYRMNFVVRCCEAILQKEMEAYSQHSADGFIGWSRASDFSCARARSCGQRVCRPCLWTLGRSEWSGLMSPEISFKQFRIWRPLFTDKTIESKVHFEFIHPAGVRRNTRKVQAVIVKRRWWFKVHLVFNDCRVSLRSVCVERMWC